MVASTCLGIAKRVADLPGRIAPSARKPERPRRQTVEHASDDGDAFRQRRREKPVEQEPSLHGCGAVDQTGREQRHLERGLIGLTMRRQRSEHQQAAPRSKLPRQV